MLLFPVTLPPTAPIEARATVDRAAHELPDVQPMARAELDAPTRIRVEIGSRWTAPEPGPMAIAPDAQLLQDALLDERTDPAFPRSWIGIVAGAFWKWC